MPSLMARLGRVSSLCAPEVHPALVRSEAHPALVRSEVHPAFIAPSGEARLRVVDDVFAAWGPSGAPLTSTPLTPSPLSSMPPASSPPESRSPRAGSHRSRLLCGLAGLGLFASACPTGAYAPPAFCQEVQEARVMVQVGGQVRRPGLYRVPQGTRLGEVVRLAGGASPGGDLRALPLARMVADGESVAVPRTAPSALPGGPMAASSEPAPRRRGHARRKRAHPGSRGQRVKLAPGVIVDLNTATAPELDGLPGVGPSLAEDILAYRKAHGRFRSVEELREVGGIGEKRLARLKPRCRV